MDPKQGITGCIRHALTTLGQTCPNESRLAAFIRLPLRDTFRKILRTKESALIEKAVEIYRERYSRVSIFGNSVYPGMPKLRAGLEEKSCKFCVVTAKPKVDTDIILRHFSLNQRFAGVFGS